MKVNIFAAITISIVLLSATACAAASAGTAAGPNREATISVSEDEFGQSQHIEKQVEIAKGGTLVVTLSSNGTTGFSWDENAGIADTAIVEQLKHRFIEPDSKSLGAPGKEQWTFKAINTGTTTVHLEYSRPWEGGEKGVWTFDMTVTVK